MELLASNGFLPFRGSFMLDFVITAMVGVVILMFVSSQLASKGRKYELHKYLQTTLAIVLLITVAAFEIDVRFITDWRKLAAPSRFYDSGIVTGLLYFHLCFAIPTPIIWGVVLIQAWRKFPKPVAINEHANWHRRWGKLALLMMLATAVTGWIFYVAAFVL